MNGNVIRTITIRGTSEGLDKLQADLAKVAAGHKGVTIAAEETERSSLSLEQALKRQALRLDEVARAQSNIARETKIADRGLKEGLIDQQRHAELLNLANQRYGTASKATAEFGKQTGLARHELINLGRQAQDVGVSLMSGQSPLTVLAQQGAQIADVFISSGKSVGSFFSQAIGWAGRFFTSTAGIVTAIGAIGAAAVYAASQFIRASTTIEEALKEQNRLLKEGKELVDARTSAEARAQLQPKDLTQFEIARNLLDLQLKLKLAREDAERRVSRPTQVPGEMGEAPTGVTGVKEFASAFDALKAAQEAGLPALKEFIAEVGKIGQARPDLANAAEDIIKMARAGIELEQAETRLRAISDALKGIATDAQLAAVGLGSVAQFQLNNRMAEEAKVATERQAQAVLQMAQTYSGMSIEVAKQLDALNGQLVVAQQITGLGQINAQHQVTINNLLLQGKTLTEAIAIADAQRAVALAQVNSAAQVRLRDLQNEMELIKAVDDIARDRIRSEQTLNKLLEDGVDYYTAQQIAAQELANATERRAQADYEANRAAMEAAQNAQTAANATQRVATYTAQAADDWERIKAAIAQANWEMRYIPYGTETQTWQKASGQYSQFNPAGYASQTTAAQIMTMAAIQNYGAGGFDPNTGAPNAQGMQVQFNRQLARAGGSFGGTVNQMLEQGITGSGGSSTQFGGGGGPLDMNRIALLNRAIELLPKDQQAIAYARELQQLQQAPASLESAELMKQLTAKIEELTRATDANTSATAAMTDVLSPFYSSDPRRTHLGFRAFAGGGIMTQYGELPLRQYQGGGMATSPQVAVFGEGSTPEAYVPVPSGRIPVEIKQPANSNARPVNVTINVMGNADAGTVAALKTTAFQQAQALRRVTR